MRPLVILLVVSAPLSAQSRELAELGAHDYQLREEATLRAASLGSRWVDLAKGLRSPDPEVRLRCQMIRSVNPWKLDPRILERDDEALQRLRSFEAIAPGSDEEKAASLAVDTLSRWGQLSRPLLFDIIEHSASDLLKKQAARKLAMCALPSDSLRLQGLLKDASVEGHIVWVLGSIYDDLTPELESLIVHLRDSDASWVRIRYWLVRGRLGAAGAYDEAVKVLDDYMKRERADLHWAYTNLAWVYDLSGDDDKGLEAVDRAIELRQEDVDQYLRKAAFLSRQRRYEEALTVLRHAESLDASDDYVLSRIGSCLHMMGRSREGIQYALRAAEGGYPLFWSANNLAWMLATTEDPEVLDGATAVAWARFALELKPDSFSILGTLGEALLADGKPSEAMPVLEQAIAGMTKQRDTVGAATERCFLALALARLDRREEARAVLAIAERDDPGNESIARVFRELGE